MNKAVTTVSSDDCSGMLNHLLDQQHDKGAAMLSMIGRYVSHFSRCYGNLDFYEKQDIRQEVAIKLLCHGEKVRGNCSKAWVYAVVRNQCINHLRQQSRRLSALKASEDPELETQITGEAPKLTAQSDSNLLNELDCLHRIFDIIEARKTGKADIALYTQYAFGLSYTEISERSKRTANAICSRISTLKNQLRALIIEHC